MVSLDRAGFFVHQQDRMAHTKDISDYNTYVMALDGDTDFHPKAVILLLDRSGHRASSTLINGCFFVFVYIYFYGSSL